jgi:hypothetical protein
MLATHFRNLDKDCMGIFELEYAPINTDLAESSFGHLYRATRTLRGADMDACIGVAHARMPGAFQTEGGRQAAAKAAVRKEHQATGPSSARIIVDPAGVDTKAVKLEIKSFFKLPKKEHINKTTFGLCAARCAKYKEYIKIKPCRSLAGTPGTAPRRCATSSGYAATSTRPRTKTSPSGKTRTKPPSLAL